MPRLKLWYAEIDAARSDAQSCLTFRRTFPGQHGSNRQSEWPAAWYGYDVPFSQVAEALAHRLRWRQVWRVTDSTVVKCAADR